MKRIFEFLPKGVRYFLTIEFPDGRPLPTERPKGGIRI